MPIDNDATILTTTDIRRLIESLRTGGHYYEDGHFVVTIADHHFATPASRGALWEMMARLVELEERDDLAPVAHRRR